MSNTLEFQLTLPLTGFTLALEHATNSRALGVVGPSGSGKSSLVEALAGWRRGARGRIRFDGATWLDSERGVELDAARRAVGYVPQDQLLFPHLDVEANLRFGCTSDGALVERVLRVLEIEALRARGVATLSGGERQRVALGRALCARPQLLLLDEPFGALDRPLRRRILPYLLRAQREFGAPFVLVSHDPTEIAAVCDEVLVLHEGRVVARGAPSQVLAPGGELDEGFENVLRGRVSAVSASSASVDLGGVALEVPRAELAPGEVAVVSVRADDVLVARTAPKGLSARNVLAARVDSLVRGPAARLRVELGAQPLWIELTEAAIDELELAPGAAVFVVVKTRACRVLASGGST